MYIVDSPNFLSLSMTINGFSYTTSGVQAELTFQGGAISLIRVGLPAGNLAGVSGDTNDFVLAFGDSLFMLCSTLGDEGASWTFDCAGSYTSRPYAPPAVPLPSAGAAACSALIPLAARRRRSAA